MNYAQQEAPKRRTAGLAFVIVLHIGIVYLLLTGLASKVVEVIRQPIETRIIQDIKPPPPPPPAIPLPPPPTLSAPPPPFIPPPEVQVAPAPVQNPIAEHSSVAAPSAPAQPVATPTAPAVPQHANVGVVCPNSGQVRASIRYPREAQRDNLTGDVLIEFTVGTDGAIKDLQVVKSAAPVLDRAAENAVRQFNCTAQGREVRVSVPFSFKLD
ncbi:energy transducer TonB [Paraburkholderia sediminicola]|jgi:protein TonB|uniref:TonB family protein n=1 Tax=Paraburkholderia sediminicola TaxID=458836 RepID=UPI00131C133B